MPLDCFASITPRKTLVFDNLVCRQAAAGVDLTAGGAVFRRGDCANRERSENLKFQTRKRQVKAVSALKGAFWEKKNHSTVKWLNCYIVELWYGVKLL